MRYQSSLSTVELVTRQLEKGDPGAGITPQQAQYDDLYAFLEDILPGVDDLIFTETGMSFVPYKSTYNLYHRLLAKDGLYIPREGFLWLPDDLMVVNEIIWTDTTLTATDYLWVTPNEATTWALLFDTATIPAFTPGTFTAKTSIDATWGYHINTSQAYSTIDSSITVNSSATSIEVDNAALFEVFGYYKCESELMQVVDYTVNTAPTEDTITVLRGVNGHTAAAHTTQPLQRYRPVRGIELAATRMAAYLYQKRNDVGGAVQIGESAFLLDSLPVVVKDAIRARRKLPFGTV